LLFALFVDDIQEDKPRFPHAFITKQGQLWYADDGSLAPASFNSDLDDRHQQLQSTLDHIGDWSRRWGVRFSGAKSGCIWFSYQSSANSKLLYQQALSLPRFQISYTSTFSVEIPVVDRYQYLGVWLDSKLSPHAHYSHLVSSCNFVSNMLTSIQTNDGPPDFTIIRQLCLTVLLPRIIYGLPFINPTSLQLRKLDAILYRPLLRSLALPISVHRAGLAVYTGLPSLSLLIAGKRTNFYLTFE
jgi:hypothetical protein